LLQRWLLIKTYFQEEEKKPVPDDSDYILPPSMLVSRCQFYVLSFKKACPFYNKKNFFWTIKCPSFYKQLPRRIILFFAIEGWTANTKSWGNIPLPRTTSSSRQASTTQRRIRYMDSIISSHKKIHFSREHETRSQSLKRNYVLKRLNLS